LESWRVSHVKDKAQSCLSVKFKLLQFSSSVVDLAQ